MATILLVEGEQSIRNQLQSMLSSQGHEVIIAESGIQGLELFQQRRPRFTLLDFQPPGMDGIQVLELIRRTDPQAAVIMLDGGVSSDLKVQAWRLGAIDFMKKNLPLKVLVNVVGRAMLRSPRVTDVPQGSQESIAITDRSSVKPRTEPILIVDDDPKVCQLVCGHFTKLGYYVSVAHNGQEALALAEQISPKLIIIDIYMPIMDGIYLARELRSRKYQGGILALTGSLDEEKLQAMLNLGAFDVIGKPINMDRLELAVHLGCVLGS
jgi:DNA-binding response OmpR family regulator